MIANTEGYKNYFAAIFTSVLVATNETISEYEQTSQRMNELAAQQPGFIGVESARSELGITVSYWESEESIRAWKHQSEHTLAREKGRSDWYRSFRLRVCRVEREYGFERDAE